jgi:HTH-type transcriptional regulator, competence development regulator
MLVSDEREAKSFGDLVRRRRLARNLTQRELANRVDIDVTYLSKLENDAVAPPSTATITTIARMLRDPSGPYIHAARKIPVGLSKQIKRYPPEASELVRRLGEREYDVVVYRRLLSTLKKAGEASQEKTAAPDRSRRRVVPR